MLNFEFRDSATIEEEPKLQVNMVSEDELHILA